MRNGQLLDLGMFSFRRTTRTDVSSRSTRNIWVPAISRNAVNRLRKLTEEDFETLGVIVQLEADARDKALRGARLQVIGAFYGNFFFWRHF